MMIVEERFAVRDGTCETVKAPAKSTVRREWIRNLLGGDAKKDDDGEMLYEKTTINRFVNLFLRVRNGAKRIGPPLSG
jgi:hypothetical protein